MNLSPQIPFPRSYWVVPGRLLAGEYPGNRDSGIAAERIQALFGAGIRCIVNLMEPEEVNFAGEPFADYAPIFQEIAEGRAASVSCLRFPVRDLGIPDPPTMRRILDAVDRSIEEGRPVYVHCWGGIGRTGTVVGCYLLRHSLADGQNVLDKIRALRQGADPRPSPETREQLEFVANWRK